MLAAEVVERVEQRNHCRVMFAHLAVSILQTRQAAVVHAKAVSRNPAVVTMHWRQPHGENWYAANLDE